MSKRGNETAQFRLGRLYAKGQGVRQSDIEAYAWWTTAAENGHTDSLNLRNKLATFMSQRDLATAKKIAGDYWKKYVLE